jgi:hypothetical protein
MVRTFSLRLTRSCVRRHAGFEQFFIIDPHDSIVITHFDYRTLRTWCLDPEAAPEKHRR